MSSLPKKYRFRLPYILYFNCGNSFMKFLYLKNKRKSYTKIFFKICYLEHQAAGVDQSGYLCESLRIHLMASLAFWWVKASDGFSYCIGREFGSVCRDVRSDTQVDGEWLLMGSGQRPKFLYICYIQLPLSPLSNH